MSDERTIDFEIGGMWEHTGWEIHLDVHMNDSDIDLCPHSIVIEPGNVRWETRRSYDGTDITEPKQWIVPRVVVAYNEGSFNSTGICLDCILDAAKSSSLQKSS